MSDIRDGRANDPYSETLSKPSARLRPAEPEGSDLTLNDDGSMTIEEAEVDDDDRNEHLTNLAQDLTPERLSALALDYLEMIETDIEAHKNADKAYEEALRRTGLGNDAPGGAPFNGASRAVHPMLTEAMVDYSARVVKELLPPEGPAKAQMIGKPTNDKSSRAERVSRYMNWQLTQQMQSFYNEIEVGLPQEALSGAFYTKAVVIDGRPNVEVVFSDKVHRPWGDGDFYSQNRITHEMLVDKHTFRDNVEGGLWLDDVDPETSGDLLDTSATTEANDRIIGQTQPVQNLDEQRTVYECSTRCALDPEGTEEERAIRPYIITIDEQTQKVLAIYRNWKEEDPNFFRLDFLIEWPFVPWRGGYPIGFGRMIGGLSGAASGALRALLDSALLNSMQTGVKLKGGVTAGGQNIKVQPGSTGEVAGSLAQDPDIRKTYMPLPFPEPSPVLFQLLGFLVDAGRGVVRTTFDEFNKMNGEMPVGTANMMIEQGLTTFGSIYGRQHRALRRFLNQLWYINQHTVVDEQVIDDFGELIVTKEDFTGPMCVIPVSDPRIFTDAQRVSQAQLVAQRAQIYVTAGIPLYKAREVELNFMRQAKVPDPEQFLQDAPEPVQMAAAAENVAVSNGLPVKAFPGQDHEAHIAQHAAYIQSPIFGANPILAQKVLPGLIEHLGQHLALWYDDAMKIAVNEILRTKLHDPRITLDALETVEGLQVQLDRLMAMVTPGVMKHAQEELTPVLGIITEAQQLLKSLQPPQPMDPSIVAMKDVERQTEKDKADIELKKAEVGQKTQNTQQQEAAKQREQQQKAAETQQAQELEDRHHSEDLEHQSQEGEAERALKAAIAQITGTTTVQTTEANNQTKLQIASSQQETAKATAAANNETKLQSDAMGHEAGFQSDEADRNASFKSDEADREHDANKHVDTVAADLDKHEKTLAAQGEQHTDKLKAQEKSDKLKASTAEKAAKAKAKAKPPSKP
jgi:chaperonin GroES